MKTTTDRMGGFISAKIIAVQDIESFSITNGKCIITPKTGKGFTILDITKNGADAQVTSSATKSGEIFNIDITIEQKNILSDKYKSFNKYLCILETPTLESFVYGTSDFPLNVSSAPQFGKAPAESAGSIMRLTGKQPNNVLIM